MGVHRGSLALGMRINADIQQKVVAAESRIPQCRISRFEQGHIDFDDETYARLLFGMGVAVGKRRR